MSQWAQEFQRQLNELRQAKQARARAPRRAGMADETTKEQAPLEPEPEQGAETAPAQEDGMAKKSAGKKKAARVRKPRAEKVARKPRAEKVARAPRESVGLRVGKQGSVVVVSQAIGYVARGLKALLAGDSVTGEERPAIEKLLARVESRL